MEAERRKLISWSAAAPAQGWQVGSAGIPLEEFFSRLPQDWFS